MKLVESIQILRKFAVEIGHRSSLLLEIKKIPDDRTLVLVNSLFYMTVIDSISFLDEYEKFFGVTSENEYNDRVRIVKSINKPLISKIKEWKDLAAMRNQILAHNLRIGKNGQFAFVMDDLNYNAPRSLNDLFLLSNLIQFATETIIQEFSVEFDSIRSSNIKTPMDQNKRLTNEDVSSITTECLSKANELKKKFNRTYRFTVK